MKLSKSEVQILENCKIASPDAVALIANLSQKECEQLANAEIQRRMQTIFSTFSTETLQQIALGDINFADECKAVTKFQ